MSASVVPVLVWMLRWRWLPRRARIGFCGCLFHRGEGGHKVTVPRDGYTADGKVLHRAHRVHTVVGIGRNFLIAEEIMLDADGGLVVMGQRSHPGQQPATDVGLGGGIHDRAGQGGAPCAMAVSAAAVMVAAANSGWWLTAGSESMPM